MRFDRSFWAAGLLICSLTLSACSLGSSNTTPPLPNILLILADDMGYGDPGCYNPNSMIPTPNMNRLCEEGVHLTDAHSPSAVCTPTRYGLMTGRYSWRTSLKSGVLRGYSANMIDTTRITLPSMLKTKGYATGVIGKWHLGLGNDEPVDYSGTLRPGPLQLGFDYYYGIPASLDMPPYVFVENYHVLEEPTEMVEESGYEYGGPYWRAGPIAPSFRHVDVQPRITEKAISFMQRHAEADSGMPFFLYVPLAAPHTPWMPTEPFNERSLAGMYGDFTAMVDASIGEMLDTLDELRMTDNTLVIVMSDNGSFWIQDDIDAYGHYSNLNWRGMKADAWEGGHRVPFIARWPGQIPEGTQSDALASLTDIVATVAAIIGYELPANAGEDSYNLLPALKGEAQGNQIRQSAIQHSSQGVFAIRKGSWKLIEGRGSGGFSQPVSIEPGPGEATGQLYNLAEDPGEQHNLYLDRPDKVDELMSLLNQQRDQGFSRPRP